MTPTESRMVAGSAIGAVLLFEAYASTQCSISLLKIPLVLAFMAIPMLIVYGCFINHANPYPVTVGVVSMSPLYYVAYRVDCVDIAGSGGAAFGALFPWLYGIPLGLFVAWVTKKVLE